VVEPFHEFPLYPQETALMSDVSGYLAAILTENFDVVANDIGSDMTLDDLGVDSVATIELIDILQEKFGITITDEELTNKSTVEQVVGTLTTKVGT
jgi:acyl carrier protein